jgi:hypothetical protein
MVPPVLVEELRAERTDERVGRERIGSKRGRSAGLIS